jgi:polyisoprenyl-teichoic acid--peptidoglycan teichoic acid transferase
MTESTEKPGLSGASKRRRRRWFGALIIAVLVVVVGSAAAVGYVLTSTVRSISQVERIPSALPTGSRPPEPTTSAQTTTAPVNVLLIGSDKRSATENGRSDSFVVLHISADRKSAYLVSFPRDMWVAIPGHGTAKINAAYSWGGSALAIQTIEQLTGARIDHVATTDFSDFVGLVDVVGGVTVDNPVASKAPANSQGNTTGVSYNWPKGPVTLDGAAALTFSRQRYELPNGDLDRALRQRALLKALALKVATPEVLANPAVLSSVISTVSKYVTVDSQMTDQVIFDLATSMRITSNNQITMLQAPLKGFAVSADGQDYDVVDVAGVAELGKALQNDTMASYVAAHPA